MGAVPDVLPFPAKRTILVVEDHEPTLDIWCKLFTRHGFVVRQAKTGAAALSMLVGVHIVISDIDMPGIDGLSFCDLVKIRWKIPVVLVTGVREYLQNEPANKADLFIHKPVLPLELLSTVNQLLTKTENR